MWYVIIGEDVDNSLNARLGARESHLERLRALQNEGRLLLAGPCPAADNNFPGKSGFTGSLIVAEFDHIAKARAWADADPYVKAGVYESVTIKPFIKALPK